MTPDEIRRAFAKVEMRVADLESAARREREERRREFAEMQAGAQRSMEEAIARSEPLTLLRHISGKLAKLETASDDSAAERVRRMERERIAAEDKARRAEEAAERRERFERQMKIFAAMTALVVALGGIAASCAGAFRTPSAAKDTTHEHAP